MRKLLFIVNILFAAQLFAQGSSFYPRQRGYDTPSPRQSIISASEAMRMAEQRTGGHALSARLVQAGSSSYYSVKVLKDGRVSSVSISASR